MERINPLEKIEQLLTCPICLERFKNPKLLACQHTFCLHCLDGYAESSIGKLKCPECRAEHNLPYDGAKNLQTNYTLVRFLDIHLEASGENTEEIEAYIDRYNMERCKICDEKTTCENCSHCDKRACSDCRKTHMQMVKKDLGRLMNQVKRLSNRLTESISNIDKSIEFTKGNCEHSKKEVQEYFARYQKELARREQNFLSEIGVFQSTELTLLRCLREALELEKSNIDDSCQWVEEVINNNKDYEETNLIKMKQMFVEGLDYLRSFQPDHDEYFGKKLRFSPGDDAAKLPMAIANFGELTLSLPQFAGRYLPLEQHYLPKSFKLNLESDCFKISKRSQALEEKNNENRGFSRLGTRKSPPLDDNLSRYSRSRLRVTGYDSRSGRSSPEIFPSNDRVGSSPWSKLPDLEISRNNKENDIINKQSNNEIPSNKITIKEKISINKNNDLLLKQNDQTKRIIENPFQSHIPAVFAVAPNNVVKNICGNGPSSSQIKPLNIETIKNDGSSNDSNNSVIKPEAKNNVEIFSVTSEKPPVHKFRCISRSQSRNFERQNNEKKESSSPASLSFTTTSQKPHDTPTNNSVKKENPSEDITPISVMHFSGISLVERVSPLPTFNDSFDFSSPDVSSTTEGSSSTEIKSNNAELPPQPPTPKISPKTSPKESSKNNINESTSTSITNSDIPTWILRRRQRNNGSYGRAKSNPEPEAIRHALTLSSIPSSQDNNTHKSRISSRDDSPSGSSRVQQLLRERGDRLSSIGGDGRIINGHQASNNTTTNNINEISIGNDEKKSKSIGVTHSNLIRERTPSIDRICSNNNNNILTRVNSFSSSIINYESKCIPKYVIGQKGTNENEFNCPRGIGVLPGDGKLLTSFGKHGSNDGEFDNCSCVAFNKFKYQFIVTDSCNNRIQIFDSTGRFVKKFGKEGTGDGEFRSPWGVYVDEMGFIFVCDRNNHRLQIFDQNGNFIRKIGSKGNGPMQFNNPLYVCVHRRSQNIYISDSGNNRISIFESDGNPLFQFGSEGFMQGFLKSPRGLFVDDQGFVTVADSGNGRVQVFCPDGSFYYAFGCWGTSAGQFKGLEDVALLNGNSIVVSDRENCRFQIF
ncbi:E3 ubiquitin-protein ligase TRIM71 [Strongyloides ratti]|uniref:E3 ubiquitin-protein ligase TRIM71 n=1 Tax=Strongyloides ratti TaxID=34506 RepID=A0A090MYD5_STRRB|nr:E3 ubiquitin-protein ligase TRIM71 [Strongyloides ratti]CEF66994.1 E3 ubiquitin-protein ligase TRIM71 [Strongyloides ratti]